ncbi:class I SAM-dependent methyltransferase [Maricaulis sp.]|uniref:class I SAM-dependent methyltransferase n=1 Tax=Maricaulis sp. TaxID=1486257 RepID=UPI0026218581|nr:class I SAM-dependent methyltransferase [Maricaulis sp.]
MNRERRFWNRMAKRYFNSPIEDEAAYEHKLEKTRQYFTPDSEVLEFGCGTGGTAVRHAPHVKHYLATDISEEMLRFGEERAREAGAGNITFKRTDFADLEADPESFDAVLGLSILHLLEDRDEGIAKACSLLKPGGVFVSSTVCVADGLWFLIPIIPIARLVGLFPLLRVFSANALRKSMHEAGFEIVYDWKPSRRSALFLICRKPG